MLHGPGPRLAKLGVDGQGQRGLSACHCNKWWSRGLALPITEDNVPSPARRRGNGGPRPSACPRRKPVLLSRSWLSALIVSGAPIAELDPGPGGIYARLAEVGHAPARFRENLRFRMPRPEETERLAIAPETPGVDICRIALDADETPVEINEMTAYVFRYEFDCS